MNNHLDKIFAAILALTGMSMLRIPAPIVSSASILPDPSKALAGLLGLAVGAALCLALAVVEWGAWALVMPGRKLSLLERKESTGQAIRATASDGTRLAGDWFPSESGRGRALVMLHGLAEDRTALLGRVPALLARGWSVALLDARTAGESGGRRSSFGARESADLIAWLEVLSPIAGPDSSFAAWGRSMGAATALRAAAADPRIAALVLEAPYRDLQAAVGVVLARFRIPFSSTFAGLILRRAGALAGVSLRVPRPVDLAPLVKVPTLILHGLEDRLVPLAEARTLALAFPHPAQILEIAGAGHANVVGIGGDGLMGQVADFLDRAVPPPGRETTQTD